MRVQMWYCLVLFDGLMALLLGKYYYVIYSLQTKLAIKPFLLVLFYFISLYLLATHKHLNYHPSCCELNKKCWTFQPIRIEIKTGRFLVQFPQVILLFALLQRFKFYQSPFVLCLSIRHFLQ